MGNMMGSIAADALLIALCVYVVRTWVRWFRTDMQLSEPKWRSAITTFGFGAGTASLVIIVALAIHAVITDGLPYYHPLLLFSFRVGFWSALFGLIAAVVETRPLEAPTIGCSLLCLLIWFVEALAQ